MSQDSGPTTATLLIQKKANVFTFALWVGKLPTSRRYNLLPLLRSSPGGFAGSWPYRTYPYSCKIIFKKQRHHRALQCKSRRNKQTANPLSFCSAKVGLFFHFSKQYCKFISKAHTITTNLTKTHFKTRKHNTLARYRKKNVNFH